MLIQQVNKTVDYRDLTMIVIWMIKDLRVVLLLRIRGLVEKGNVGHFTVSSGMIH